MPTFFRALDTTYFLVNVCLDNKYSDSNSENNIDQLKTEKYLSSPKKINRFSPLNCCLSVVLYLDKGDYPNNSCVVVCSNNQRSFEHFKCLDLVLERQQLFLFQIFFFSAIRCIQTHESPLILLQHVMSYATSVQKHDKIVSM